MELDRLQDARSTLQAGMRVSEELGAHWHLPFYEAYLALERFLAGGWDDASAELDAALQLVAVTGERHSLVLIESLSSLIALHRGDQRHAEEAVARAEHELSDTGPRFRSHWATWARALVLEAGGATEQAFAAEDAGVACARHGEVDSAVPLLAQALAGYESLEAGRDTARAEARLRDLGVRRGRRGARRRPPTGWESLTPTEHRVVDLVVEGLSNPKIGERLFISRRTVQTHLAHVFTKLGISSRTQLAAEATRRRPAP
jgi:DNA-binding CsgD family transcriptional regulator